jgi:hypothetical protein
MVTARDLQEPHVHISATNYSENNSTSLHGLGSSDGSVVGTTKIQTLTNKTIDSTNNTITVAQSRVTGLTDALDAKAPIAHTHIIADVTDLQTSLDGKAATSDVTDLQTDVANLQTDLDAKAPLNLPVFTSNIFFYQPAPPSVKLSPFTLTTAECLNGIVICATTGSSYTITLPTGSSLETDLPFGLAVDSGFRWSIINIGSFTLSLSGNTGHTYSSSGSLSISAGTSASFITRKTGVNAYITYRVA